MNLMVVKDRHLNLPSFLHVDSVLLPFLDHLVSLENKSGIFGGVRHGQFGSFCHGPHREFPFFHQDDLGGAFLGQSNLCVNCWWRRKKIAAAFPLSSRANSVTEVKVLQTNVFARAYKKLHPKRKDAVDKTVASIIQNPNLGEEKKSELAGVFVYKFDCVGQLNLLACELTLQREFCFLWALTKTSIAHSKGDCTYRLRERVRGKEGKAGSSLPSRPSSSSFI